MKAVLVFATLTVSTAAFAQTSLTADAVYEKHCAKCHGKNADGRHFGGPSLQGSQLSVDEIKAMIANGKKRMPAFKGKLTDDQISALATEIKALTPPAKP